MNNEFDTWIRMVSLEKVLKLINDALDEELVVYFYDIEYIDEQCLG